MANYIILTLDTTAPTNPSIIIDGGATYTANQLVNISINTSDASTVGYQMKIWGDVDALHDSDVQALEGDSNWITYQESKQIKTSEADGNKTLYLRIRDDVHNVSSQVSDSIILDASQPTVTMTGADVDTISKNPGKNEASFSFQVDQNFEEYKVKIVGNTGAAHDTGLQVGTTNGSTNMYGVGSFTSATPINIILNGSDLEAASAGDGDKIIKVFVKDAAGNWSA